MAIPTKFLTEYSHPGEKLPWWENARLAEKDGLRWSFILDISSVTLTVLPSDCKTLFIAVTVVTIIFTIITSILNEDEDSSSHLFHISSSLVRAISGIGLKLKAPKEVPNPISPALTLRSKPSGALGMMIYDDHHTNAAEYMTIW